MDKQTPLDFVKSELPTGLSVIEASAGTGKTYAISHLVPRLLLDGTVESLGEILLVTFTNDAARELSDRVRRVLEKLAAPAEPDEQSCDQGVYKLRETFSGEDHRAIMRQALIDIDRLNVSTIHSFCQRTIQAEGTLCGLPAMPEVITSADDFIEEALYDLWQERIVPDRLLATIAADQGWDIQKDSGLVKMALSRDVFESVPEAKPFDQALDRIKSAPRQFTEKIRGELAAFIQRVCSWNKSGGDAAARETHLRALDAKVFSEPAFGRALKWVSGLDGHISGKGKAGKECKAEAEKLPAVLLAQEISGLANRLQWDWQNECVLKVRQKVQCALHAKRQITQDGLILTLRNALRSPKKEALAGRLRQRYKVALIDESQDTDPKQFEIFRSIFIGLEKESPQKDHRLVMIGDPKQAIYGFRGADVNTYLEARNQARQIFTLATTYRSPQPLVDAVNAFFRRPNALLKDGLEFHPATSGRKEDSQLLIDGKACDARVEAWIVPEDNSEAYRTSRKRRAAVIATVASEIVRLLNSGTLRIDGQAARKIEPRDFAILTNSNVEAELTASSLKERGVPAIVASGADVLGTEEAKELLCILRSMNEPRRSGLRYAALATRLLGHDSAAIGNLRSDPVKDDDVLRKFSRWQAEWERKGIAAAIALIDREESITARIAISAMGERRVTNLRQLIDLLQAASQEHANRPELVLRWLAQEIERAANMGAAEERQIQLESDRDAVQVVTMHKAKGLEYNLVFAPFLWSSREPDGIHVLAGNKDDRKDKLVNLDLSEDTTINAAIAQCGVEDRLRVAYVAMTRAKVRLWIYGGEMGNTKGQIAASPLDWLLREDKVQVKLPEDFPTWAQSAKSPGRGGRHAAGIQSIAANLKGKFILQTAPPEETRARWRPETVINLAPLSALPSPTIGSIWSLTSFSSLTREKNPHGSKDPEPVSVLAKPEDSAPPSGAVPHNPFLNAPGGMLMGTAIHDWLQRWDGDEPDQEAVGRHLQKYHLRPARNKSAPALEESVFLMLKELRGAILPGLACMVAEACPAHEASEWHFHLPIKDTLSPHRLAEAFARHAAPEHQPYATMLELLSFPELEGLLHGFMDRLALHQGAVGVIDWKTNQLGSHPDAYLPSSMLTCAMESHYLLQTHLYLVALRRYQQRVAPNARLAGAWLVFLRAVQAGTSDGVLHIHPGANLLDALDGLFFAGN